ncbi:MAG TPA: type VI secretion system tube protein Hcp [Ferruginibacter sp.]|nr:type VI secretion system tube protein Hcp [Ferruginibacter sp.]HMP19785.1 type VI secretion system tube protein Hcp [Ferruginibacter sp.]
MKKIVLLLALAIFGAALQSQAQKILMKITNVTDAKGEEVRALELQMNRAAGTSTGGGGTSVGKTDPGYLIIKKTHDKSTNELFKKMAQGTFMPEAIFEYYDASNTLYYKITLTNVLLMQFYYLSPECPGCLKLEHQVAFSYDKIKVEDLANGGNNNWDIKLNIAQ